MKHRFLLTLLLISFIVTLPSLIYGEGEDTHITPYLDIPQEQWEQILIEFGDNNETEIDTPSEPTQTEEEYLIEQFEQIELPDFSQYVTEEDLSYIDNLFSKYYELLGEDNYSSNDIQTFESLQSLENPGIFWNFNNSMPLKSKEYVSSMELLLELINEWYPNDNIYETIIGKDILVTFNQVSATNSNLNLNMYLLNPTSAKKYIVKDNLLGTTYINRIEPALSQYIRYNIVFRSDGSYYTRIRDTNKFNIYISLTPSYSSPQAFTNNILRKNILYSSFPIYTDSTCTTLFYGGGPQVYNVDDLLETQVTLIQNQTDQTILIIVLLGVLIAMLAGTLFFKLVFRDVR